MQCPIYGIIFNILAVKNGAGAGQRNLKKSNPYVNVHNIVLSF